MAQCAQSSPDNTR